VFWLIGGHEVGEGEFSRGEKLLALETGLKPFK